MRIWREVITRGVYFIQTDGKGSPIKIGVSTCVEERIEALDSMIPDNLTLLAVVKGAGFSLEQRLHRAFRDYHRKHEWFNPGERLMQYIQHVNEGREGLPEYYFAEGDKEHPEKLRAKLFSAAKRTKVARKKARRKNRSRLKNGYFAPAEDNL